MDWTFTETKYCQTTFPALPRLSYTKAQPGGGWRGSSPPLAIIILIFIFLVFHQHCTVSRDRVHCKMFSGSTTGVATHSLSNQAVMNFRDLRNIEAAFFIPVCFALPYITRAGCCRALPVWKQAWHLNYQQCWLMCSLYVTKLGPSQCTHVDDMHQCYHLWCFEGNFWCLMFWQYIWCWLTCCFFPPILYPFRMKIVRFIIFKFLSSISHSHVCLVIVPNWRSSLPSIGNNITRYRFFHLMTILRSVSDSTWVIALF